MAKGLVTIQSDRALREAVDKVSELLQEIHDHSGRDFKKPWKIRFPRGYIRPASNQRKRLEFLKNSSLKDNLAYTLILSDVIHWLLIRTDLGLTAKQMLIKLQLFLLGALVESITKGHLKGRCGGHYRKRTQYLVSHRIINVDLKKDLDWIWEMRNHMHLFLITDSEYNCTDYSHENLHRGVTAFKQLLTDLET